MPRVVLVRHGETDLNAKKVLQSHATPLNQRGHEQAKEAGAHLAQTRTQRITKILHSDMVRTRQTATHILEALKAKGHQSIEMIASPLLRERNFGDLQGQTYAKAVEIMGGANLFRDDDGAVPPRGESMVEFHIRTQKAWDWIKQHVADDAEIIVVTHGMFLYSIASRVFQVPKAALSNGFGNTSITIVPHHSPENVEVLNSTAHLPSYLVDDTGTVAKL